ncbi:major histocompatibility complex class I-related gene protein-like isoform X1 [Nerophis ophidion]|uniref:major histocompatibility complex class I-related gene protein-like isoform X1 n=1 Tax=Nerophis ophidion TaxID=159077 RepID=UPI002AE09619|nr:major histocompatibility complex class I-related gene protein-like isoform X1 [Nerophis ophidion]
MMNLLCFFLLVVQTHSVTPVIHTLQYFRTACSQVPNFPEYVDVGYVDEVEVSYYDSNIRKAESKQDWMNKITAEDPNYWQRQTEINVVKEHVFKDNIEIAMKRFNQTGGVHTFQVMTGCEWNDETDEVKGWRQFSYDGEDFISLDMKTWTFTAAKQQAFPTKLKWDQDTHGLDDLKYYYTEICPSYLKKYVEYGKKVLMRTELPKVFLLQKTPSSPVTCMATGFYPDRADLFWRKDGEQIFEDVEHGELLPNHDGTFQLSVELKVEVTAEVEGKYECVFQLSGVKEDLVTKLERRSILSNASHEGNVSVTAALAVLAVVLLLAAPIIIIFIIKRRPSRQAQYDPAGGCNNNANTQQFHSIYAKLAVHCGIEASKTGNATTKILPMVEDSEDSIPGAFKVVPRLATLEIHYFLNNTRPIMYSIFAQKISIRPILPIPAWILLGIGSE